MVHGIYTERVLAHAKSTTTRAVTGIKAKQAKQRAAVLYGGGMYYYYYDAHLQHGRSSAPTPGRDPGESQQEKGKENYGGAAAAVLYTYTALATPYAAKIRGNEKEFVQRRKEDSPPHPKAKGPGNESKYKAKRLSYL